MVGGLIGTGNVKSGLTLNIGLIAIDFAKV